MSKEYVDIDVRQGTNEEAVILLAGEKASRHNDYSADKPKFCRVDNLLLVYGDKELYDLLIFWLKIELPDREDLELWERRALKRVSRKLKEKEAKFK